MKMPTSFRIFAAVTLALIGAASAIQAADVSVVTPSELWALFDKRGIPQYPYEARRDHVTGPGIYRLYVEPNGKVRTVGVLRSTGSKILDLAAAGGLYQWHAKAYPKLREIDMPVTFLGPGQRPPRRQ